MGDFRRISNKRVRGGNLRNPVPLNLLVGSRTPAAIRAYFLNLFIWAFWLVCLILLAREWYQ